MNNFVKIEDLYDSQARRNKEKEKLYDTFLTACTNKIKKCASEYKQYTCIYEVPPFKIGHPQYDPLDLKRYIIKRLRLNGFFVREEKGSLLFISWKPEDFNYALYQKYLNYLNSKYDEKINKRLIMASGNGNGNGNGNGSSSYGSKKAGKTVVGADPNDVGLLTYGSQDSMDAIPVNLKQIEKRRLDKKVFFKN
jgi:hypothetical protein